MSPTDIDDLFDGLAKQLEGERGPRAWLRSRSTFARLALLAALALIVPLWALLLAPRVDLPIYPRLRLAVELIVLASPAVCAWLSCLRPLYRPPLPRWVGPALMAFALGAAITVVALPPAHADHPASLLGVGEDLIPRAVACFALGAAWGIPIMLLGILAGRTSRPAPTLFALAALAGMIGLQLHCPLVSPAHLFAGHATVTIAYLVAAAIAAVPAWIRSPRTTRRTQ